MHNSVPCRGVWGHAPLENFGILDTHRVLLVHVLTSMEFAHGFCHTRKLKMYG